MYNWIDGRKNSEPKHSPVASFVSKNYVPFVKNPFDLNNFKRLPVIKEEEGYVSEEEVRAPENQSSSLTKNPKNQGGTNLKNVISNESKSFTKLPPLVNINCLMNTELKQTQSIWDTAFGRRLIGLNNIKEEVKTIPTESKKIPPNGVKICLEKFADYEEPRSLAKRKTIRTKSVNANKEDGTESRLKKKSKHVNRNIQNLKKKLNQEKQPIKKIQSVSGIKSVEKCPESPSRETTESCPTSFSKNQRFLTECVQSILDGQFNKIHCEHCDETFQNVEELCSHKKKHEAEKEVCLLCGKQFYNPNEFIQHLLTHESVDRHSCKKCKKYFPSLRKYKQHYMEHHLTPEANCQTQTSVENMRKWFSKLECKRCKIEFDTEKQHEAHRRNHIRSDLAGAYLLSPKRMN